MTPPTETSGASVSTPVGQAIDAATTVGPVSLTVSDLARSREFYERATGLRATELEDGGLAMGAPGGLPLVELHGDASAAALDRRATGLYHLAILLPSRLDLAQALVRLARGRWPLDGASDHLVSEALYLSDPDGNGIEIYRDRPREEWRYEHEQLQMATLPLDLEAIVAELDLHPGPPDAGSVGAPALPDVPDAVPAATTIGHVHLQVSNVHDAEAFYSGVLGFDVTVSGYPGALFVSAGGYHHHIGLNTWHSAGRGAPAPGSIGLRRFEVQLPSREALDRVLARVTAAGLPIESGPTGEAIVLDPSGNCVLLRSR